MRSTCKQDAPPERFLPQLRRMSLPPLRLLIKLVINWVHCVTGRCLITSDLTLDKGPLCVKSDAIVYRAGLRLTRANLAACVDLSLTFLYSPRVTNSYGCTNISLYLHEFASPGVTTSPTSSSDTDLACRGWMTRCDYSSRRGSGNLLKD